MSTQIGCGACAAVAAHEAMATATEIQSTPDMHYVTALADSRVLGFERVVEALCDRHRVLFHDALPQLQAAYSTEVGHT